MRGKIPPFSYRIPLYKWNGVQTAPDTAASSLSRSLDSCPVPISILFTKIAILFEPGKKLNTSQSLNRTRGPKRIRQQGVNNNLFSYIAGQ